VVRDVEARHRVTVGDADELTVNWKHGLECALIFDLVVEVLNRRGRASRRPIAKRFGPILGYALSVRHQQNK